jgi:GTPase
MYGRMDGGMSEKLPTIVLVGRPNVGKSTLFNRLTGTRDALVADLPGLTRDRQYGTGVFEDRAFVVVDTGGLMPESRDPLAALAEGQARMAIDEADHVLLVVDTQAGLTPADAAIARELRKRGKPLTLVVNKAEGRERAAAAADFFALGFGEPLAISAENGQGVPKLLRTVLDTLPAVEKAAEDEDGVVRVAIVGRPNVGKSTLVNRLLGEERLLAADVPGTTRDAIAVPFEYDGKPYRLIDTAGVRRRARVWEGVEKISIVKTLQAIERAHVVIAVVDAQADIGEQDARLMGLIAQRGCAMVLAVNKWDGIAGDVREQVRYQVNLKLPFLDYAPTIFISARHGSGLGELMEVVQSAYESTMRELPTGEVTRVLEQAVESHQPPAVLGRRIKLRYAHQGGKNPPRIVVHGNQTDKLPASYKRYLANRFREAFKLVGVPLLLSFKTGDNPYKDKKNVLTARQIKKKRRMMSHVKR